jgi:hypothetical protein
MSGAFFVVGFVRSGSTALARILDTAANAEVSIEIPPKLLIESRDLLLDKLTDPVGVLRAARRRQIDAAAARKLKFGDKNAAYMPFLPYVVEALDAKIVAFYRDGRDAVRSLMDWHEFKAHNLFIRAEDGAPGPDISPEEDPWGYAYLRPLQGDEMASRWPGLNRFEKSAWYWAEYNRLLLERAERLPRSHWIDVNLSTCSAADLARIFDFLGLEGFDAVRTAAMLGAGINSLYERTGVRESFPRWPDWSAARNASFREFAGPMMKRLGYF